MDARMCDEGAQGAGPSSRVIGRGHQRCVGARAYRPEMSFSGLPDEYRDAYHEYLEPLNRNDVWAFHLNDHRTSWAGQAITAALLLTGPTPPVYVQPWSDAQTGAFGAHAFGEDLFVVMDVGPAVDDAREVTVAGLPLVIESIAVGSSVAPWVNAFGSTPQWPGNVSAVVRLASGETVSIPNRAITNQDEREAAQRVVSWLTARLRRA